MGASARQCGTYSVTEHFKKWQGLNLILGNMYECKFLVEAGGGTGSVDLTYLKFSQENEPRGNVPAGNFTLTTAASPESGGTVTKSPNSTSYSPGTSVTVTATAKSGYRFDGWSGDATSTTSPVTISMNANKTVTAKFTMIADDTTNLIKDGNFPGSSLSTYWTLNQGQYYGNSEATVTVSGGKAAINVKKIGADPWNPQIVQAGLPLDKGTKYRLTFDAQASVARELQALLQRPDSPWTTYTDTVIQLTTATQTFKREFEMTAASNSNGQVTFNLGQATGTVTLSKVSLIRIFALSGGNQTGIAADRRLASPVKPTLRAVQSSSGVKVSFKAAETGSATLRLYNIKGDVLSTASLQTVSGKSYTQTLNPSVGKLPGGFYIVGLQRNGGAVERMAVLVQ